MVVHAGGAGSRTGWAGQHSDNPYTLTAHTGIKTAVPATPADAYGHRRKANIAETLAAEIRARTGEETLPMELTYDLRSGQADALDPRRGAGARLTAPGTRGRAA